jgi:membrane fusion protein (multidrug efflux system)
VQLGEIIGNDYVVQSGLAPGEQLIVSGLQKIRDGAPVMPAPPASPASPATPEKK